jgi:pyruvate,water dikinase
MSEVNPKDYVRVFGGPGMPFITSYMFAHHYSSVDFLITCKYNIWTAFLKKDVLEKTLEDGVKFYSDRKKVLEFEKAYQKHFKDSIPFFEKIAKKNRLSKSEAEEFFRHAGEVLSLYVKLEFFYTERAFQKAGESKALKQSVEEFDRLKKPGKEQIIRVFFDEHSYIYKVLAIFSRQFGVLFEHLVAYKPEEVIALFDKNIVPEAEIMQRNNFYILKDEKGAVKVLYDGVYSRIIDEMVPKIKPMSIISGTVANKGKYTGKVKLFNHGYEFYKVAKLTTEMKKGDVLVTETTSPELTVACHKAGAIVTNEGGLLSHAAIISRELKIPCIVGVHGITSSVKDGDLIEVDADKGTVRKLK